MARGLTQILAVAVCGVLSADGVRVVKKRDQGMLGTAVSAKIIADVPVLNYDKAYGGKDSLADSAAAEENWIMVALGTSSDDQLQDLCSKAGNGKCVKTGHPSAGGFAYFEVRGTEEDLRIVLEASKGLVKFVEPDGRMGKIPDMVGVESSPSWGQDRIGVPARGNEGADAHVFVLDTGIRRTHREFGGRVIPTLDMSSGGRGRLCNGNLNCAPDVDGHGTHCASTVGGTTFGVASKATIHNIKVLNDYGEGEWSWTYAALDFMAASDIRPAVASLSLGDRGGQAAMKSAVDSAVASGVHVVVAGGNDNIDACAFSPAFVPSAITVGSTTSLDRASYFSNYGRCVDIWAPGSDIRSASAASDGGSRVLSGTSMACPHVAGAVALLVNGQPRKTSGEVLQELYDNAVMNGIRGLGVDDTNALVYVGAGGAPPTPQPVPTPAPTPAPTPVPTPQQFCPEYSFGPDPVYGDCQCDRGYDCWWGDDVIGWGIGCPYSMTPTTGHYSKFYFDPECAERGECGCF
jgi:subtilisin family serine protease